VKAQAEVPDLVAIVGMRKGWGSDYVRAAYRRWFQLGQETGSEPNVSESLRDVGQDPARVLALANSEDTKAALNAETNAVGELGIFGSPTFTVDRELFWGDDRLEDAISWCRFGRIDPERRLEFLFDLSQYSQPRNLRSLVYIIGTARRSGEPSRGEVFP
jgi:DSBA-like thioredoxin domain-containing protein